MGSAWKPAAVIPKLSWPCISYGFIHLTKPTAPTYSSSRWLILAMVLAGKGVKNLIFWLCSLEFSVLDIQIPHVQYQNSLILCARWGLLVGFYLVFGQIENVFVNRRSILKICGTAQSDKGKPFRICIHAQTLCGLPLILVAWQNPAKSCSALKPPLVWAVCECTAARACSQRESSNTCCFCGLFTVLIADLGSYGVLGVYFCNAGEWCGSWIRKYLE